MAHSNVRIVSAYEDLSTLGHDVSVAVDSRINDSLTTARANSFDLGNRIRDLKKTAAAREEVG